MDRELLLELGCEELPAAWLPTLTEEVGERVAAQLRELRLPISAPVETFSTPRRLVVRIARVAERQTDFEELVTGPPVAAAFGPDNQPTPAGLGFARKQGVEVGDLQRIDTPRGQYVAFNKRQRGRAAIDVLPDMLTGVLREVRFPRQLRWDACLDDERGDLPFGRPIRWILFLYGGRVVPFVIPRSILAQTSAVQEVRSGAHTYGHRFLATSGRAGRALKVRSFEDYRARLAEHFVVLDRGDRHDRVASELDAHARRLGGRVSPAAGAQSGLLQEIPDLVEYPSVVAGTFAIDFLDLPEEVLTTTMIRHQHYVPVINDQGRLMPAFLAVTNTQADSARTIARNAERVLTARLRDARFFWKADRSVSLESRLERLETVLFHQKLGTYREKAARLERGAEWIAREAFARADQAEAARLAARLAKADLVTDMVREFTELQGTMGGVYARHEGYPEPVWKAIYYHYQPVGVEADLGPTADELGAARVTWAAVSLADKLDTIAGLFAAGEEPTGTRDPFGLRRLAQGVVKALVDLPELAGVIRPLALGALLDYALEGYDRRAAGVDQSLATFFCDRLRYLFERRGFQHDEINAVVPSDLPLDRLNPLDARLRLQAVRAVRATADFQALAILFKRVKNIAREAPPGAFEPDGWALLEEPAEVAILEELERREPVIRAAAARADYTAALLEASAFRPAVDRFFTEVFVMVPDERLRTARLHLMVRLRDLVLDLADISEIVPQTE